MLNDGKGLNIMTTANITTRIRRRSINNSDTHTPMVRQWQLLEWLSSDPKGITVGKAAKVTGVSLKTIRRDLILLQKIGFDLEETEEEFNRKRWRVRQPFERLRSKKQQYQAIRQGLDLLLLQVEKVGDKRLLNDLEGIRKRVRRKCG